MILEYLRQAMEDSGITRYRISQDTGIDQAVLSRLANGGSCSIGTIDTLCEYLGLELKKTRKGAKR